MRKATRALLLGATSLVVATMAGQALAQTAEQRIVRLEAELRQLRNEVSKQAVVTKEVKTAVAERPAYAPAVAAPYNWSGVYGGVFVGAAHTVSKSNVAYGPLSGDGVGFGANGTPVKSTWYDIYGNGGPSSTTPYIESGSYSTCYNGGDPCDASNSHGVSGPNSTGNRTDSFAPTDVSRRNLVGALGVQAGANYQYGSLVMGMAGDFSWLGRQNSATYASSGAFDNSNVWSGTAYSYSDNTGVASNSNGSVSQQSSGQSSYSGMVNVAPKWLSTARLTAGIAQDRFMTFVSGGLAFGSVQSKISSKYNDTMRSQCDGVGSAANHGDWNSEYTNVDCGDNVGYQSAHSSETQSTSASWNHNSSKIKAGYSIGGGFAYALTDVAILKLESYYYSLGKTSVIVNGTGSTSNNGNSATPINVASYKVTSKVDGVLGRVGVDFKY